MSVRSIHRYARWAIRQEATPPAEPAMFEFECTTCGAEGPASEDFELARTWIFVHVAANPEHTGFHEHVHRYWRASLVDANAAPADVDPACRPR